MKWHFWLHPLRGVAAILVVLLHSYWTWGLFDNFLIRKLYMMVDLFFVLSGFVIASGYINKLNDVASLRRFLGRRVDRLRFQYLASGLAWLISALAIGTYANAAQVSVSVLRYISLTDFIFLGSIQRINPVTWSVMTEVWVYISLGMLMVFIQSDRTILSKLVVPIIFATLYLGFCHQDIDLVTGIGPLARAVAGFFTGVICYKAKFTTYRTEYFAAILVFHVIVAVVGGNGDLLIFPIAALLIYFISNIEAPKNKYLAGFLQWLGEISFPLYVWHFLVSVVIAKISYILFSKDYIVYEGEKFLKVSDSTGNILCMILISISLAVAQVSIYIEGAIKRRGLVVRTDAR